MRTRRPRRDGGGEIARAARLADDISAFEEFREEILPALQKDLRAGLTSEQILQKWKAVATARMVTLAHSPQSPGVALSAAKDILDRTMGKATERKEVTHKLAQVPDKDLDAILVSQIAELEMLEAGDDE